MVSVITCVLPRASEWLAETWNSVESQILPDGWAFEFLVQIDGEGELKSAIPENDPRIHISRNPRPFGPAIARNMALGRASGVLVKPLDADDMLPPGTLSREIDVLDRFPDTGWVISKTLDLRPDGTTVGNPLGIEPIEGPLSAGVILDTKLFFENHPEYPPPRGASRSEPSPWWTAVIRERTAQGLESAPVHPTAIMARKDLVVMLGGWPGVWSGEDTALLLNLEAVSPGYFLSTPGLLYREWPDSFRYTLMPSDDVESKYNEDQRHLMLARVEELRRWGITWKPGGTDRSSEASHPATGSS